MKCETRKQEPPGGYQEALILDSWIAQNFPALNRRPNRTLHAHFEVDWGLRLELSVLPVKSERLRARSASIDPQCVYASKSWLQAFSDRGMARQWQLRRNCLI
jgi:hypothetical protein